MEFTLGKVDVAFEYLTSIVIAVLALERFTNEMSYSRTKKSTLPHPLT